VSDHAYLSIGEVLQLLQDEFPDVTISKIRFLESQGLIDPERTPSGYRKFYDPDIDRLKFILREQKDSYLPLKVIKGRLDAGEGTGPVLRPLPPAGATDGEGASGRETPTPAEPAVSAGAAGASAADAPAAATAGPDSSPSDGVASGPQPSEAAPGHKGEATAGAGASGSRPVGGDEPELMPSSSLTFEELVTASGLTPAQLREVERYGLVVGRPVGRTTYYDDESLVIARLVAGFLRYGIEPRHVRMYRTAAEREAGVFEQVILPLVKQRNPQARAQALASLSELTQLGTGMRDAMMRQALRAYTDSL
jgi:DNA-binding transcriptional MerR regulator